MRQTYTAMPPLRVLRPRFHVEECLAELRQCLEAGWTGLGFKTLEFENAWRAYTGHAHAHFLNSATAGLFLAVRILKERRGWSTGDEVISTPITFVSTNHAILAQDLSVVFADVDETGCLDPASVASRITSRTRAVMYVGLGGNTGSFEAVRALCNEHGLALILDAAHMTGTRLFGSMPGPTADAAVYSYQALKNLPTGDAGMVCFAEEAYDRSARQLAWLGIDRDTFERTGGDVPYAWRYDVTDVGDKSHGNSIMAAIALVQLRHVDEDNRYRRQLSTWYDEALDPEIARPVPISVGCESSRHLYQILTPRRHDMIAALNAQRIHSGVHYRDNTEYPMYESGRNRCSRAKAFSDQALSLPLHLAMDHEDVLRVSEIINSFRVEV